MGRLIRARKQIRFASWLSVCVIAFGVVAATPAFAGFSCETSGAPQCGGACPAGLRCVPDAFFSITIQGEFECMAPDPVRHEAAGGIGGCECAEVLCGGIPLQQNQGCCNGRPFTLGTQGCCSGVILDASEACPCGAGSVDLATTGCCGEGEFAQQFDPASAACCQQIVMEEGCEGGISTTSTFNLGFDCCPGAVAADSEFCDGPCNGSECAATGCCQCENCFGGGAACAVAGSSGFGLQVGCIVGCFAQACEVNPVTPFTEQPSGMCTENGLCVPTTAAPAASHVGLLLITALLAAAGCLALAARRKSWRDAAGAVRRPAV